MKVTVAVLDKQGKNTVERVLEVLNSLDIGQLSRFGLISAKKSLFEKNTEIIRKKIEATSILIGYITAKSNTISNFEHFQLDDAALLFEGKIYSSITKNAYLEQIKKEPLHLETTLQTLIKEVNGDYSFLMLKKDLIAAGRDPMGVQPLYYGENKDIAVLSTNQKALWKFGIDSPVSFPPGNLAIVNCKGFKFKPIKTLTYTEPKNITMDEAVKPLWSLLEESIHRRLQNLKEVTVAFSGGLDSSLVAFLANKIGVKVNLLHVSLENQLETEEAIRAADELDLPLQVYLFKDSDVERSLPKVIDIIEEPDPMKASIGLSFYWVAEKAVEAGSKVILAGQGADELFGGYQRYVNEFCNYGIDKIRKTMFNDVIKIHENNLERDLKICNFFDEELRLPFASFELAEFALGLPIELKIESKIDTIRKLVLRKAALNGGIPVWITEKHKKAVQYSTGINDAIKRIAKKRKKTVKEYINEIFLMTKNNLKPTK